jgi:hypothetical protein
MNKGKKIDDLNIPLMFDVLEKINQQKYLVN